MTSSTWDTQVSIVEYRRMKYLTEKYEAEQLADGNDLDEVIDGSE